VRLSKIAHLGRISVAMPVDQNGISRCSIRISVLRGRPGIIRPNGQVCAGQVEFPSAVEADFVRTVFNREYAAEVTVATPKNKLVDTQEQFHKSCARWRRSELPLASSHSSRERTLARARAIAQSAAP